MNPTSKILLLVSIVFTAYCSLSAQVLEYSFGFQAPDTWQELTQEEVVFSGTFDDDVSQAITTLPITMGGEPHTSLFISTNGFITLSSAPSATNYDPMSTGISAPVVAALATNLEGIDATSKVSYFMGFYQGIIIQWKNVRRVGYPGESLSFQVRLESFSYGNILPAAKIIYGPFQGVAAPTTPVHVGIRVGSGNAPDSYDAITVAEGSSWISAALGNTSNATCALPSGTGADAVPPQGMKLDWLLFTSVPSTPSSPLCNSIGNLVIYSNYDGGTLNINVDQNIPNLKIGICTYEPVEVNFSGPFVGNISEVLYAGFNSNAGNNHCGLGINTTSIVGVDPSITQILTAPPLNYQTTHGNGQSNTGPFGGSGIMVGVSGQCDTLYWAGGGNTPDEVVYYFLANLGDELLFHHSQYNCWLSEVYNISDGGTCCINPLQPEWNIAVPNDTVVCFGGSVDLLLTENEYGEGPFTYAWTYNTLPICDQASCTFQITENGEACVTVTDALGQQLSECFIVDVNAPAIPSFTAADTALCMPATFSLTNTTDATSYTSLQWTIGDEVFVNDNTVSFTPALPGSFDVLLEVSTAIGCAYDTLLTNYLHAFPQPEANYTTEPLVLEADNTDVTLIDLSQGEIATYEWIISLPGEELSSMEQDPEFSLPLGIGGSYPVQLTVTTTEGCSSTIFGVLTVNELFNLFVPTAFTPNGDGINDVLFIEGSGIDADNFQIEIFNRWGESVYVGNNLNEAWTGGVNDNDYYVSNGLYSYHITVNSQKSGERFEYRGYLSIIR